MEDTESISTVRVSNIVAEFTHLSVLRADVRVIRRPHGGELSIIPISVSIRAGSMVVSELVIRMRDPERSWRLICVDQRERSLSLDDQVAVNKTFGLSSIFNEDSVSQGVVSNISDDTEVVHSVDGDGTVVSLVDSVSSDVRLVDGTNHMEM